MLSVILGLAALIAGIFLYEKFIAAPRQRREAEAAPRITLEEAHSFWDAIEAETLPIARAQVQDRDPSRPDESRIGGAPLAIEDAASWPRAAGSGEPMFLLAQINFAELPAMDGFPDRGVLQIFTSLDAVDQETDGMEHVTRWEPDPTTETLLDIPTSLLDKRHNRDLSDRSRSTGLPLVFEADEAPGNPYNWPFTENDLAGQNRLPENDSVAEIMEGWEDSAEGILESYGTHWVGGHPSFVQYDVREVFPQLRYLTRVLFHMGYDDDINIGDGGMLNVMISEEDLKARRFSSTYLTWDCH